MHLSCIERSCRCFRVCLVRRNESAARTRRSRRLPSRARAARQRHGLRSHSPFAPSSLDHHPVEPSLSPSSTSSPRRFPSSSPYLVMSDIASTFTLSLFLGTAALFFSSATHDAVGTGKGAGSAVLEKEAAIQSGKPGGSHQLYRRAGRRQERRGRRGLKQGARGKTRRSPFGAAEPRNSVRFRALGGSCASQPRRLAHTAPLPKCQEC